jgi:hypothetical protein
LATTGKNKSVGPTSISGEILKLGGEAMNPYIAQFLDITVNNAALQSGWRKTIVFLIYRGGDRSLVSNYRPISLTSVVCKQMEQVIASYLRKIWDKKDWLFEMQHGFRPGYSCGSQIITVCQDNADSLDNEGRVDAIATDFAKAFALVPHNRLLAKIAASGVDSRVVVWIREILLGPTQSRRAIIGGSQSNVRSTARKCTGSTAVPCALKLYLEKY